MPLLEAGEQPIENLQPHDPGHVVALTLKSGGTGIWTEWGTVPVSFCVAADLSPAVYSHALTDALVF